MRMIWPLLQYLRVSDASVGHVAMNATASIPAWPRSSSSSNCFVVSNLLTAKGYVVHAALRYKRRTTSEQDKRHSTYMSIWCYMSHAIIASMDLSVFLTCDAAHTSNALKMTSTTLWDVRTFPPTTAAFWEGWRIEPGGMMTLIGARQPWLRKSQTQ